MKKRLLISYIIFALLILNFGYSKDTYILNLKGSEEVSDLNYLHFTLDENSNTNKISFELLFNNNIKKGDIFELNIYYKDEFKITCKNILDVSEDTKYTKITCEVPKLGDGKYDFKGKILREDKTILTFKETEFISNNLNFNINFDMSKKDSTPISIKIGGNSENITIENFIPKEVIEELTEENKNQLILSEKEFTIIDSDPLIAWNIERTPTEINYTINKKISKKDTEKFKIGVKDNKTFNYMKYIVFFLIVLIILFLSKPLFIKK